MSDDVIPFPVKPAQSKPDERALRLVYLPNEGKCTHAQRYEVDESANTVKCRDCGADLNPIWVLVELAHKESLYLSHYQRYLELKKKIDRRVRTLCEHCKRMTHIRGL